MRQLPALAIGASALAGCSLLYNPNNLPSAPAEAGIDAPSDAEVILDADPRMLEIDDVAPSTIYEGQGDAGSAPVLIVIRGRHIIDNNTVVEITPTSGAPHLAFGAAVIARSGNWIAIPVTAHVDAALKKTDRILLDVKVTESIPDAPGQTSMSVLHGKLVLQGLEEFPSAGSIDTTTLDAMYSKVDMPTATTTFSGANRAIIHSMSSITAKAVTANGADGGDSATVAVAGGCPGGGPASTGGCNGTVGGQGGTAGALGNAGGGGGGGFATNGIPGGPPGGGAAGSQNGDELIAVYDANRSGGGGGGGKPTLGLGSGGGGGGGGGAIELTAGGDISVGAITANGGLGGAGATGGGGGAGGVIMLRAEGALTVGGAVSVNGGDGGKSSGGNGAGGAGSPGRVRWDAQSGGVSAIATGTLHRGPAFLVPMRLFRDPVVNISLAGTPSDVLSVYAVNGGKTYLGTRTEAGSQVTIGPDGSVTFHQLLEQGLSQLCVTVAGGKLGTSEGDKCIDVAFLP
jgi:hypothetical protein